MTRRELLAAALAGAVTLEAQAPYPGVNYPDYSRCLPDFLRSLAAEAYRRRTRAVQAALASPSAFRDYQRHVREVFWKLAGGMPERTPLNARSLGGFERPAYRVEKIAYESQPGLVVPANLYVPKSGAPPYPGVLFQMGHSLNGKAAETYQRCCQGLVQLGFLVLAFDPMGQGERVYYPQSGSNTTRLTGGADAEHTVPGRQMLLAGDTATRMQVWDAIRSLDYLAAHPLADAKRLASAGQSGGGTLTMLLAAVDDRLAAAAVSSGNTENFACANYDPPGSTDDAEQNLIASGPAGFDRWDLLYPFAPKPLLVTASARDWFGTYSPQYLRSGWEEFARLEHGYTLLGQPSRLSWDDTPLPHSLSYHLRMRLYQWFARWLQNGRTVEQEPPAAVEKDETLWVTQSGSVVQSLASETPFSLLQRRAREVKAAGSLAAVLAVDRPRAGSKAATRGRVASAGIDIEAIDTASAPGVRLPAWLFLPRESKTDAPVLVLLEPQGRNGRWQEGGLDHRLALRGCLVCAADVRGVGDLAPEASRGAANYAHSHQQEESWAWASVILGKPLAGQRATDLLALVEALSAHPAALGRRIVVAGAGKMGIPAIAAASLDSRIAGLYLAGPLISYRNIVETENYTHPFASFAPGALSADLPDTLRALAPRPVVLAGTVDAAGVRLPVEQVRAAYADASHVTVEAQAEWTEDRLARL